MEMHPTSHLIWRRSLDRFRSGSVFAQPHMSTVREIQDKKRVSTARKRNLDYYYLPALLMSVNQLGRFIRDYVTLTRGIHKTKESRCNTSLSVTVGASPDTTALPPE